MKKKIMLLLIVAGVTVYCNTSLTSQTISYYATGEEFSGPLPGWKNIKTDFGAKGDGVTDDAPAITAALYTFRDIGNINYSVLYFPAGTYRLGSTILNADRGGGGSDYAGMAIVGEDPSNTILLWDGTADTSMLMLDGWGLKVSRLTFDGQNKAKIGIFRNGTFGTFVEYSDLVFKDLNFGVQLGNFNAGQAENLFLRCRFLNCGVGVFGSDMNSLDIWLWYCLFQDCSWGIHLGGYQAYGNVFLRSKTCDLGLSWQNCCIVNNISVNSKSFNRFCGAGLFQGNKIYDPDTTLINAGGATYDTIKAFTAPFYSVILDNLVKTNGNSGPAIKLPEWNGNCISVGNTFTQSWPVRPSHATYSRGLGGFQYPVTLAVDGDPATFFRGYLYGGPYGNTGFRQFGGIVWNCPTGKPKIAVKYSLTENSDPVWFPVSFRLVGSNDWGYHVTVLDSQVNQTWAPGETRTFTFQNTTPYSMYRLEVMKLAHGDTAWAAFEIAEFSLIDATGANLMKDPGFVTGGDEPWGYFYSLQEKIVPYSSITNPEIIELPGTPPLVSRKIFEVRKGTTDNATEIQTKIDSAAAMPPGTRPIVHIPKGIYYINKTLILPANVEMTLNGDGIYNGGTQLIASVPDLSGPLIRIAAPSHLLVRDIELQGNEAIYAEVDDKPGSRVTCTLFNPQGIDWYQVANTAMVIDGIEQSNMLFSGFNIGNCYNGVLVKGGPILSSGGSSDGQIAFLSGASGFAQNMFETQKNGKVIAQGMWHEADFDHTKSFINLTGASSGSIAIVGMNWYYNSNPYRPFVSINDFSGQFMAIVNTFGQLDKPELWQLTGNGTQARILSACNLWSLGTDSVAIVNESPYWIDQTSPSADASRIFCSVPDITNKVMNTLPDSSSLLSSLAFLRSLRIKNPSTPLANDSHLDFKRVVAYCPPGGVAVRFIASPDPYGRPDSPTLISPSNGSTDVKVNPTMNWNGSTGASEYRLQVSQSTSFNPVVFEDSTISATTHEINSLITNTSYYWRVLAKNPNGISTWSPVWSFTTGNASWVEKIGTEIPAEFKLDGNYPNPFNQRTSIIYSVPSRAKITLTIIDGRGYEIASLVNEEQIAGKYEVEFDGSKLPGGIYYYRLQSGEFSETRKMILVK